MPTLSSWHVQVAQHAVVMQTIHTIAGFLRVVHIVPKLAMSHLVEF